MKISPQFLRFCGVGIVGFIIDLAVLYSAAWYFGWYVARVISFLTAATVTWWLNRRFTFQSPGLVETSSQQQYLRYLATMTGGAVLNYATYVTVLHWVQHTGAAALGVSLGSCVGLFSNYFSARNFIFRRSGRP